MELLEVLDLSDNGIKGSIPSEIGLLSNLKYLRLCYNQFTGHETDFGDNLKNLETVQLHGNRLSGEIPSLNWTIDDYSSFITDCGTPVFFEDTLSCEDCTMCCNIQGNCYPQKETNVGSWGFTYSQFTLVVLLTVFGISCVTAMASFIYDKTKYPHAPTESISQLQKKEVDFKCADEFAEVSVYQFFLGKSVLGWVASLGTVLAQGFMLFEFVKGAEIDLSDDASDLVYTWFCPRDNAECRDLGDLTKSGWFAFFVLMIAHILKDIINGMKMIVLSGKARNDLQTRIRFFVGGTVLFSISLFTFYASVIYNAAIASSNTEIIMNSVVIVFICDVDELFYDILLTINPDWVERSSFQAPKEAVLEGSRHDEDEETNNETKLSGENRKWETTVQHLEGEVQTLKETFELVLKQNEELKQLLMSLRHDLC